MRDKEKRYLYRSHRGNEYEVWAVDERAAVEVLASFGINVSENEVIREVKSGMQDVSPIE